MVFAVAFLTAAVLGFSVPFVAAAEDEVTPEDLDFLAEVFLAGAAASFFLDAADFVLVVVDFVPAAVDLVLVAALGARFTEEGALEGFSRDAAAESSGALSTSALADFTGAGSGAVGFRTGALTGRRAELDGSDADSGFTGSNDEAESCFSASSNPFSSIDRSCSVACMHRCDQKRQSFLLEAGSQL